MSRTKKASESDSESHFIPPFPGEDWLSPWAASSYLACARDVDGRIISVNQSFAKKFGHPAEYWVGRHLNELVHAQDQDHWLRHQETLRKAPHHVEHELRWLVAQGCRWIAWEDLAVLDDGGRPCVFRSVGRDVTRQMLSETHSYKLVSAVEQSPVSILITDLEGSITYANPRFTAVSGYSLEELLERGNTFLSREHATEEAFKLILSEARAGKPWKGEVQTHRKDGSRLWESIQVSPIRNPSGEVTHLLFMREDITDRRLLEEQLRQAQKMESLGSLAGGIAHDFNNMLAIINGYTEVCLGMPMVQQDESVRRYLREVYGASQRAVGLVQRILTFSRKAEVRFVPLNLNKMVRELGNMMAETFPRTITFDFDLLESLPMLEADQNQMQQVVMNLCVNARDAMGKGGRITVKTRNALPEEIVRLGGEKGRNYICISVSDTGSGIPPEIRERIFEPFFTTKQDCGGTGLGLAMVYGIVHSHHGLMDLESALGHGSTFSIYLPTAMGEGAGAAPVATKVAFGDFPAGTESLLVIEDELSLRNLLSGILEPSGYTVHLAKDGREAIRFFEKSELRLDAVILDLNMPGAHGIEVYKEMRRLRPGVKALVVSGNITRDMQDELQNLGQREFLAKPYRLDEICHRLRRLLDSGKS